MTAKRKYTSPATREIACPGLDPGPASEVRRVRGIPHEPTESVPQQSAAAAAHAPHPALRAALSRVAGEAFLASPACAVARTAWRGDGSTAGSRVIPEEIPVAFTYNHTTHAVMLATPDDLEDFAVGFSLTEGIVRRPDEIDEIRIVPADEGIELRMWLGSEHMDALTVRQRRLAGPSGCGLCGLQSLADAIRQPPRVAADPRFSPADVIAAMGALPAAQHLNRQTRTVHAAAFWHPQRGLVALREDVGRHNALDKLAGALARAGVAAANGLLLLSSRISVELVQKAAMIGAPVVVAVSAPTALAVRLAETAGITLIGIARGEDFEVFTHPERIAIVASSTANTRAVTEKVQHVA